MFQAQKGRDSRWPNDVMGVMVKLTQQTKRRLLVAVVVGALLGLVWFMVNGGTNDESGTMRQVPTSADGICTPAMRTVLPIRTITWHRW